MQSIISASIFTNFISLWQMLYRSSRSFHREAGILFSYSYSNKSALNKLHVQFPGILAVCWSNETGKKNSCKMRPSLIPICVGHIFRLTALTLGENSHFSDSHCQVWSLPVVPVPVQWLYPSKAHSMGLGLSVFAQGTYWLCFSQENYHWTL